jgi:hypothetical protein
VRTDAVVQVQVVVEGKRGALPRREPGVALMDLDEVPAAVLWRYIRDNDLSPELLDRD